MPGGMARRVEVGIHLFRPIRSIRPRKDVDSGAAPSPGPFFIDKPSRQETNNRGPDFRLPASCYGTSDTGLRISQRNANKGGLNAKMSMKSVLVVSLVLFVTACSLPALEFRNTRSPHD